MDLSDQYIKFAGLFEGLGPNVDTARGLHYAYKDLSGIMTIGYGHVITPKETATYLGDLYLPDANRLYDTNLKAFIQKTRGLTLPEVIALKRQDDQETIQAVNQHMKAWKVTLNQREFDCLADIAFNAGPGALDGHIRDYLLAGDYDQAGCWMAQFNKAYSKKSGKTGPITGLTWRRYTMVRYWFSGILDQVQSWPEARQVEITVQKVFQSKGKTSPLPYDCNRATNQLE